MIDGYLLKWLSKTKQSLEKGGQWKRFKRLLKRQLVQTALEGKRELQLDEQYSSKIQDWCYRHSLNFNEKTRTITW